MKTINCVSVLSDPKSRSYFCSLFITVSLICGAYIIGSAFLANDYKISLRVGMNADTRHGAESNNCKNQCRPSGSEALPAGIVVKTSNLEMRPLWGPIADKNKSKHSASLLAIAAGIKQKEIVNQIVKKFHENDFVVMLFHYDGVVNEWSDLEWSGRVIHVSAMNQTKWWFAKRFLHPDIVAEYDYIFLWDEDLGVRNFHPGRYISIVKEEGLEISQPALDPVKSEVHHQITARMRRSRVHRRIYKSRGSARCDANSSAPPCIGWVEMMAPVFSRAAWRCVWYMIQNDLIHAWGLDKQLGYCAQGDRTKKVGVVDSEYIVHLGLPTLGASDGNKLTDEAPDHFSQTKHLPDSDASETSIVHKVDNRPAVRRQSFIEMQIFMKRWNNATEEDKCWVDPYQQPAKQKSH
ncbi:uncharacterized protein LOC132294443 isoform X2 [Cornus florida]|uniref:uncharacterized protein LOC132294443 isoform X2 n=1 Tax=Cornus florida TaxID=4283 RepID=UPI00289F84D4|nr:uncharacterized protein LOC132294443 isoform X2 [Cornus florida]